VIEVSFKVINPTGPTGYGYIAGAFEPSTRVRVRCSKCGTKLFMYLAKPSVDGIYYKNVESLFALDHTHHEVTP
jgi:hypothetical protein